MGAELRIVAPAETGQGGVEFMLPKGRYASSEPYELALPPGTVPTRVAMLANGFPDADNFLEKLAVSLGRIWPETEFVAAVKASADQLNIGIQEPLLTELTESCDAAVIAWGHCGSCTSGVTRDALAFTARGIPNVTLICDIFWDYSAWLGKAMGLTGIPKLQIPFPLAGTPEANQTDWADRLAPDVVAKLEGR